MKERLLIVGSVSETYRRYVLDTACNKVKSIVLITDKKVTFESQITSEIIFANTLDATQMYQRVTEYFSLEEFAGIFTYDENAIESVAELAQKMGLNFISPLVAKRCRDKYAMRSCLQKHDLLVPSFKKIQTVEEGIDFYNKTSSPVVIKPLSGWGSIGVKKIMCHRDLHDYFNEIRDIKIKNNNVKSFIIENYISGIEFSVESIVSNGNIYHYGITEKVKGSEPYFEEIGHKFPAIIDESIQNRILLTVTNAIKALGITIGATHSEVIVSGNRIYIVEIANRLGGDKIPYLVYLATGQNMASDAIDVSLGNVIHPSPHDTKGAAIKFLIPSCEGYLKKFPAFGKHNNSKIIELCLKGETKKILLPPNEYYTRLGHVIAIGSNSAEAFSLAESIINQIKLEIE